MKSIVTSQSIITGYNVTELACNPPASTSSSISMPSNIVAVPTTSAGSSSSNSMTMYSSMPLPIAGEKCDKEGLFVCSGLNSFAQCVFGQYIVRNCTTGTVCRQTFDTNPPSIYCGFP